MSEFLQLTSVATSLTETSSSIDVAHIAAIDQVRKRWQTVTRSIRNNKEKTQWRAIGWLVCPRCYFVEFPGCQDKLLHAGLLDANDDVGAVGCPKCNASTDASMPWGQECRSCHGPKVRPELWNINGVHVRSMFEAARNGQRESELHVALVCPDCLTCEFMIKSGDLVVYNANREICEAESLVPLNDSEIKAIEAPFVHFLTPGQCKSALQRVPVRLSHGEAEYCFKNHSDTLLPAFFDKFKKDKEWSGARWWTKLGTSGTVQKRVVATSGAKKYEDAWNMVVDRVMPFQEQLFKFLDEDGSQGLDHSELVSGLTVLMGLNNEFRDRSALIAARAEIAGAAALSVSAEETQQVFELMNSEKHRGLYDHLLTSSLPLYFDGAVGKDGFLVHLVETVVRLSDKLARAFAEMRSGRVVTVRRASMAVDSKSSEDALQAPVERVGRFANIGISLYKKDGAAGLEVWSVQPGKGADLAGIKRGDRLLAVDEERADGVLTFLQQIRSYPENATTKLRFARGGQEQTVSVTVGAMHVFAGVLASMEGAYAYPRASISGNGNGNPGPSGAARIPSSAASAAFVSAAATPTAAPEAARFNRYFYSLFESILFDNVKITLGIPGPIPVPERNWWAQFVGMVLGIMFLPFISLVIACTILRSNCLAGTISLIFVLIVLPFYYLPGADLVIYFGWINNTNQLSFHEMAGPITMMTLLALLIIAFAPGRVNLTDAAKEKERRRKGWMRAKFEYRRRRIAPNWLTNDKFSVSEEEQFPSPDEIKESDQAFRLPWWANFLILLTLACGHSLTPGIFRVAHGDNFLAETMAEQTVAVMNIVVCVPLVVAIGYLCRSAWLRAYYLVVVEEVVAQYTNPDEAQANGLKCFLDLSRADHLEFWLFFRNYARQNLFVSFRWVLVLIGCLMVLDISMLIAVLVEVIGGAQFKIFSVVAVIDVIVMSAYLLAFLLVVVRANMARLAHVECLEKVKFTLARRVNFIREEHDKLAEHNPEMGRRESLGGAGSLSSFTVTQRRAMARVAFNKSSRFPASAGAFLYQPVTTVAAAASANEDVVVLGELQTSSGAGRRCTVEEYERERQVAVDCLRLVEAAITQLKLDEPISIWWLPIDKDLVVRLGSLVVAGVSAGLTKIFFQI